MRTAGREGYRTARRDIEAINLAHAPHTLDPAGAVNFHAFSDFGARGHQPHRRGLGVVKGKISSRRRLARRQRAHPAASNLHGQARHRSKTQKGQ